MGKKFIVRLTEQELAQMLATSIINKELKKILGSKDSKSTSTSSSGSSTEKSGTESFKSTGDVSADWNEVTKQVIDNFEGGYWNYWECKNHPWHRMYKKSGETLFGLDRKAGNIENLSSDGREFFRIIDEEKKKMGMDAFCKKWVYNYRGGELEGRLKDLASKIMFGQFQKNMSNYVKDQETKRRIESNPGLLMHMSYATWNGPGFFQKFAKKLEDAVKRGASDEELINVAKSSRTSSIGGDWAKATAKVNNFIDRASTAV